MNVILLIITRRQVRRLSTVHARQASTTRKTIHDTANSNANTGSRRLRDQGDLLRSLHALQLGFSGQPTTTTPRLKGHTECTAVCAQGNGRARAWHWTIVPPRSIACTTWQTLVPHTDLGGWRRIKNGVRSPLPSFLPPPFRPPAARHSTHALHCTRHTTHPHELDCALHTRPAAMERTNGPVSTAATAAGPAAPPPCRSMDTSDATINALPAQLRHVNDTAPLRDETTVPHLTRHPSPLATPTCTA